MLDFTIIEAGSDYQPTVAVESVNGKTGVVVIEIEDIPSLSAELNAKASTIALDRVSEEVNNKVNESTLDDYKDFVSDEFSHMNDAIGSLEENKTSQSDFDNFVSDVNDNFSIYAEMINTKASQSHLLAVSRRVGDLEEAVSDFDTQLASKADSADLEALETTVASKADSADLEALENTVESKANTSVVNAIGGRVNTLENQILTKAETSTVEALTTTVNSKASKSELLALTSVVNTKVSLIKLVDNIVIGRGYKSIALPENVGNYSLIICGFKNGEETAYTIGIPALAYNAEMDDYFGSLGYSQVTFNSSDYIAVDENGAQLQIYLNGTGGRLTVFGIK